MSDGLERLLLALLFATWLAILLTGLYAFGLALMGVLIILALVEQGL